MSLIESSGSGSGSETKLKLTTAERNALLSPEIGDTIFNTDVGENQTLTSDGWYCDKKSAIVAGTVDEIIVSSDVTAPSFITGFTGGFLGFELIDQATGTIRNVMGRQIDALTGTISFHPTETGGGTGILQIVSESCLPDADWTQQANWTTNPLALKTIQVPTDGETFGTKLSSFANVPSLGYLRFRLVETGLGGITLNGTSETILGQLVESESAHFELTEQYTIDPLITITDSGLKPYATDVLITGTAEVGEVLTGSYTYNSDIGEVEGTSTFRWLKDDVAIGGETSSTYVIQSGDVGSVIRFEVVVRTALQVGEAVLSVGVVAASGNIVTLSGTDLGAAPNYVFVRSYEDGVVGETITLEPVKSTEYGTCFLPDGHTHPTYMTGRDGKTVGLMLDGASGVSTFNQLKTIFDANRYFSVISSYSVEDGHSFAGGAREFGIYPVSSVWKSAWAMDEGDDHTGIGYGTEDGFDCVLPSAVSHDSFYAAGNSNGVGWIANRQDFDWGGNNIYDMAMDCGTDAATMRVDAIISNSFSRTAIRSALGDKGADKDYAQRRMVNTCNIMGWAGNADHSNTRMTSEYHILLTGESYRCRVYYGDAANLYQCDRLIPAIASSWSATNITVAPIVTLPVGMDYIFVMSADGTWKHASVANPTLVEGTGEFISQPVTVWNSTYGLEFGPLNSKGLTIQEKWNAPSAIIEYDLALTDTMMDIISLGYGVGTSGSSWDNQIQLTPDELNIKLGDLRYEAIAHDFTQYINNGHLRIRISAVDDLLKVYINEGIENNTPIHSVAYIMPDYVAIDRLFYIASTPRPTNVKVYAVTLIDPSDAANSIEYDFSEGRDSIVHNKHNSNKYNIRFQHDGLDTDVSTNPTWFNENITKPTIAITSLTAVGRTVTIEFTSDANYNSVGWGVASSTGVTIDTATGVTFTYENAGTYTVMLCGVNSDCDRRITQEITVV